MKSLIALSFAAATLFLAAPARADQPSASGEMLAPGSSAYERLVQRYDTNHDGKLDENELAAAHEAIAQERFENGKGVGKKIREELLEKFDKNHNGRLDPDERAAARDYLREHADLRRRLLLERYDKNGDGKLDDEERAAVKADLQKMRDRHATAEPNDESIVDPTAPGASRPSANAPPAP